MAGYGNEVPGVQINRFCASGLDAINFAAAEVMSGQHEMTIGGGVEWALINSWTVKLEYLYLKFGDKDYFPNTINGLGFDADANVHTIKLGLNYRFGYGKDPYVAARY